MSDRLTATRALLLRHGQSTWNAEGRWQGQENPPLSELGERQAIEAAGRLDRPDAVWASDLQRARRTAQVIAEHHDVPLRTDERLRERHGGQWQGLVRVEIEGGWPGYLSGGARPEGYETDASVSARVLEALGAIAREHVGGSVVVVTHGGVVRTIERLLEGTATSQTNGPATRGDLIPNLGGRELLGDPEGGWVLGDAVVLLGDDTVTVPGQL